MAQLAPAPVDPIDFDDLTGRFERDELSVEDLERFRAMRQPEDRLAKLEKKQDEQRKADEAYRAKTDERLGKIEVAVADIGGQMKVIPDLVSAMKDATSALREREHITLTSRVEVDTAKKIADVEVDTAKKKDAIDAGKARRDFVLKIGAAILTGGVLGKLLHMAGLW